MTSSPLHDRNVSLNAFLDSLAGAKLHQVLLVQETGLLTLSLHAPPNHLLLALGLGPVASSIAILPHLPLAHHLRNHPLIAAIHAHLLSLPIRSASLHHHTLSLEFDSPTHSNPLPSLVVHIGKHGSAQVFAPNSATVVWPPTSIAATPIPDKPIDAASLDDLLARGPALVLASDTYRIENLRKTLLQAVAKYRQRFLRRLAAIQADLDRLQDVPKWQKIGSLLLAQGAKIPKGVTRATLVDWESNEPLEVLLAPDKPAQTQAAEFFQKARRLQRGAPIMNERLAKTAKIIDASSSWSTEIQNAPADWNQLQQIAQRLATLGVTIDSPQDYPKLPSQRDEHENRKSYHLFRSSSGHPIWVGRSGKDNDALVTRLAKPHHLWLHAKNLTGAHVIVPLEKNHSCPPDVLVDAATLAAHFSSARNEAACEISYAEKRYVRKPRKSAPGLVVVDREKVILVRIEKVRLTLLLESKE